MIPRVPIDASYFWRAPTVTRDIIPSPENAAMTLEALKKRLNLSSDFTKNDLIFQLKSISSDLGIPYKIIMKHCRAVMIGLEGSPGVVDVCCILGRQEVLQRLEHAIIAVT